MSTAPEKLGMPVVGLGTYQLRGNECVDVVQTALAMGYRHIDTAETYGNEAEVGQALANSGVPRESVFVTTKVWPHNFHRKDFLASAEESLRRLKMDYVDLLLLHWPNDEVPLEEPLGALEKLIADGKVCHGGVSNFSAGQMKNSLRIAGPAITCNQVKCHLGAVPADVIRFATDNSIVVMAYSPLAKGAVGKQKHLRELAEKVWQDCEPSWASLAQPARRRRDTENCTAWAPRRELGLRSVFARRRGH
ncbi:aldo/keto reductase [Paraburkholderia bryophila]